MGKKEEQQIKREDSNECFLFLFSTFFEIVEGFGYPHLFTHFPVTKSERTGSSYGCLTQDSTQTPHFPRIFTPKFLCLQRFSTSKSLLDAEILYFCFMSNSG